MLNYNFCIFILLFLFTISCNKTNLFIKKDLSSVKLTNVKLLKLNIPKDGYIYVNKGETIYSISNKYGLIPKNIIEANNLKQPFSLTKNQRLFLPYPLIHNVKNDDTIFSLSVQFAVNQSDIVELNNLKKPFELNEFQKIKIPLNKDYSVIGLTEKIKVSKRQILTKNNNFVKAPMFIWPAKGKLLKKFGPHSNGKQHNDGVDIEVNENEEVIASFDGKVAFVGSNIKSFGNMILIKHDKKWITAYSKVGKTLVSQGDFVKKGDIIASMEDNNVLHFQIRKSRNPVNPEILLN